MAANSSNCPINKVDSNITGLAYAEEQCIGVLPDGPVVGDRAGGIWRPMNPNEYDDFGGETSLTARDPITASRQEQKGVITDLEASGGFNQDVTHSALQRPLQGFFFADARERPSSQPISDDAQYLITLTALTANGLDFGTGSGGKLKTGDILRLSNMSNNSNNRNNVTISSVVGDSVVTGATFVPESATPQSKVEVVGFQFPVGDLSVSFSTTEQLRLQSASQDLTLLGYNVGEWIFIGGDNPLTFFDDNQGYARIEEITSGYLTLKEPTWTPANDAGAGKLVQVYTGTFIRNEDDPALIKRRSYQFERTLGQDNNGVQSEYITGAVADQFTLNLSTADKMTADLSYMALNNELRSGSDGLKPGNRDETFPIEDAFNTTSDVFQMRLFINDPLKATPESLYAKVMEASISIENNASGNKCIGNLGNFDITVGNFVVTGEVEAYFSTVAAVNAVKRNADAGFNLISTKDNTGFVYDIPLLSLGGGRVGVEKDEPIKLPLEKKGAENHMGFTLGATFFNYLPDAAMAEIA